jgi:hypothetical protein
MLDAWKERLVFWNLNFLSTLVLDVPTTWTKNSDSKIRVALSMHLTCENNNHTKDNPACSSINPQVVDIRAELFQRAFLNTQVKLNKCKCNALGSIQQCALKKLGPNIHNLSNPRRQLVQVVGTSRTKVLNKINIVIFLQGSWPRDSEDIYMG